MIILSRFRTGLKPIGGKWPYRRSAGRTFEPFYVLSAAALAGFGVLLVNLAQQESWVLPALTTFLVLAITFGLMLAGIWVGAPTATPLLLATSSVLTALGFVTIYRLDQDQAGRQVWWLLLSAGLAWLWIVEVKHGFLENQHRLSMGLLFLALGLIALPVLEVDADLTLVAWSTDPSVFFHPGPIVLLVAVFLFASFLANQQDALIELRWSSVFFPSRRSFLATTIGLLLILVGTALRDPGTALLLLGLFLVMAYLASNRPVFLIGGLLGLAGLVVLIVLSAGADGYSLIWTDPLSQPDNAVFSSAPGLFALGSGEIFGVGLGQGSPHLIPEATTSLVIAVIGEELGLVGSVLTIVAYSLVVLTGFGLALRARGIFHKLVAAGLSLLMGSQLALTAAAAIGLAPTAIPIPFLSYGLSLNMAGFMVLAILARISHLEHL